MTESAAQIEIHPLTAARWDDLAALFGKSGAFSGCWCMYWRLPSKAFSASSGQQNRAALQALAAQERSPGLLAYADEVAVGWVAVGPRPDFARLERSRVIKPVDATPVWCIVCFFVHRKYRGMGVAQALLRAAVQFAAEHGAQAVEGYPIETEAERVGDWAAYTGTVDMFRDAGFRELAATEAASGGKRRVIMRYDPSN
jgi:GNAT superfamily N-acetyltransferase